MTSSAPCSCDDALRWKRRALAAELSLAFARRQLEGVLALMPRASAAANTDETFGIGTTEGAE